MTTSTEKIDVARDVMKRMEKTLDPNDCAKVLADVAHGLPRDFRKGERDKYLKAGNIDDYLEEKRQNAITELEKH
ncbi:MAG: hypothetical protein ACW968_13290, partial [Candidatus Thorarchaeota archaeon]